MKMDTVINIYNYLKHLESQNVICTSFIHSSLALLFFSIMTNHDNQKQTMVTSTLCKTSQIGLAD